MKPFVLVLALALMTTIAAVIGTASAADPTGEASAADSGDALSGTRLATKAFRVAANKVRPSIVFIEAFGGVPAAQGRIGGIGRQGEGPTTGLIVSPDGYIVTSTFNFIQNPPIITVVFPDGQRRVAKLLGRDETRKICLLKVDGVEDMPVPEFVARNELRVGQWAISVGVGFGDTEPAISAGIISATSRIGGRAVQTDANTSPANYGGPLVDVEGRVIGICVPLSPGSQETGAGVEWYDSGISFAVPLHDSPSLLTALKEGKTVRAGYLGIQPKPADDESGGVVVAKVMPKSAAEKAELKEGDRILTVDGEPIADGNQLRTIIARHVEGDTIKLLVKRGDEELELEATLIAAPQRSAPAVAPPTPEPRE